MTIDDILRTPHFEMTERQWLKEVAYQLARLNEAFILPEPPITIPEVKRGPGRPKKVIN